MNLAGNWSISKWHAPPCPDGLRREPTHSVATLALPENMEIMVLANFGLKIKVIAGYTGLRESTVRYRLKVMGIRVTDFREGKGPIARMVFEGLSRRAADTGMQLVRINQTNPTKH